METDYLFTFQERTFPGLSWKRACMKRNGVRQVPDGSGEQGKMEKTGCKIICGAPTTLAVKGLMMMMVMTHVSWTLARACAEYETTNSIRSRRGTEEP